MIASAFADHARQPPLRRKIHQAGYAAELLCWAVYLAPLFEYQTGTPFKAWAAVTGLAALWLLGALWASRSQPRDFGAAWWSLFFGGGAAALLWRQMYPSDWGPVAVFVIRGIYISIVALNAAHFVVAVQPFGIGRARRIINRELRRRNAPLVAARQRRFFFR